MSISAQASGATTSVASADADEARIEHSLRQLDELHAKLRTLRPTIPQIVGTMNAKYPNSDVAMATLNGTLGNVLGNVATLKAQMSEPGIKALLEEARQSQGLPFTL